MRYLPSIMIVLLLLLAGCTSSESNEIADANDEEVIPQENGDDSNQSIQTIPDSPRSKEGLGAYIKNVSSAISRLATRSERLRRSDTMAS